MKISRGFTLTELIIVIVILVIGFLLGAPTLGTITGFWSKPNNVFCENGYRVIKTDSGTTQMLDENGKGIKCVSKTAE